MKGSTPLEEHPEVNVEKIQRRLELLFDRCKGKRRYGVYEHISPGKEVGILDSKRVSAISAGEGDTMVVRVRGCSGRVANCTWRWRC